MNDPHVVAAPPLDRAGVGAHSRALVAASIEIRQESRDAIETIKVRIARSRIELARLRETCRNLVIRSRVAARGGELLDPVLLFSSPA